MARLGCSEPSTLRMSGTRRTTRSESGRQLRKPTPAACWASWDKGASAPGEGVRNFVASSPAVTNPALTEPPAPLGASETKLPSTTGAPSIARAKTSSGVCPAAALASARSFSANRKSKAIAAAPARFSVSTSAARRSRGHGHCPSRLSNSSSISTMRTGWSNAYGRGFQRWYWSNTKFCITARVGAPTTPASNASAQAVAVVNA